MPNTNSSSIGNWEMRERGPQDSAGTVLLLPGGLCNTEFLAELMAEPRLSEARLRLVAAALPGHGGTRPVGDLSIESYATLAAALAAEIGADAVVGHSLGANVAIEMAASGQFSGQLVLLAPSLSREDEAVLFRLLDRLSSPLGHLPYSALLKILGPATKKTLPPDRHDALVSEWQKNDPRLLRTSLRHYFQYLNRHGSVARRLCESGVKAWFVLGAKDDVSVTDAERRELDACPRITVVSIPDAGHFTPNTHPGRIAELILDAVPSSLPARPGTETLAERPG